MRIVIAYLIGVALVFIVNLIRFLRCCYYQEVYNSNFKNKTSFKNHYISQTIFRLLRKGNIATVNAPINLITDKLYISEFNESFESAKGFFLFQMRSSIFWPYSAIKKLVMFAPIRKIQNPILSILTALIQLFITYLITLHLDSSGIGQNILNWIYDTLNHLF